MRCVCRERKERAHRGFGEEPPEHLHHYRVDVVAGAQAVAVKAAVAETVAAAASRSASAASRAVPGNVAVLLSTLVRRPEQRSTRRAHGSGACGGGGDGGQAKGRRSPRLSIRCTNVAQRGRGGRRGPTSKLLAIRWNRCSPRLFVDVSSAARVEHMAVVLVDMVVVLAEVVATVDKRRDGVPLVCPSVALQILYTTIVVRCTGAGITVPTFDLESKW